MSNAYLTLSQVDMTFPGPNGGNPVLRNINLAVRRGEYISLIGHSGCGKSPPPPIVAGLLEATSGGVTGSHYAGGVLALQAHYRAIYVEVTAGFGRVIQPGVRTWNSPILGIRVGH